MEEGTLYIRTFGDAVSIVFALHERFGRAHSAVVTDDDGLVLDLTVFTEHTAETAMVWAHRYVFDDDRARRIVLLSAVHEDVRELVDDHVAALEAAREAFEEVGVEVLDWIRFDGEWTRSLALSSGLGSWDGDETVARLRAVLAASN